MTSPVVQTISGAVTGAADDGVHAFKGIPFAHAARFAKAVPHPQWTEPRDCTSFGPVAPQRGLITENAEAECLSLNIWTPEQRDRVLPVLFFIHGGAFVTGAGSDYDGAFLARQGRAVIVTINYRLGPLGFLQLGRYGGALAEANNLAVSDCLTALDWVRDNITAFGGDADAITLCGQSAGASLVVTLMTLPQARGKFARCLALSVPGRGITPSAQADDIAARHLHALEIPSHDAARIRDIPVARLLEASERVGREVADTTAHGTLFGPVLDGDIIPRDPRDAVAAGVMRDRALWLGSCRDEMVMFLRSDPPAAMIRVTETRVRADLGDAGWDQLLAVYRATARGDEDPYEALLSDAMWHHPMRELAALHSAAGGEAWLSRFDHAPALMPFAAQGPTHGADNACLWAHIPAFVDRPVLKRAGGPMTPDDIEVAARLQACVLRFVVSGVPDDEVAWPRFVPTTPQLAIFDAPFRVVSATTARGEAWARLES